MVSLALPAACIHLAACGGTCRCAPSTPSSFLGVLALVPKRVPLCQVLAHQPSSLFCHALLRRPHPALQHAGAGKGGNDTAEYPAAEGAGKEGLGNSAGAHLPAGHHLGPGFLRLRHLPRPPALPLHHPQLPARSVGSAGRGGLGDGHPVAWEQRGPCHLPAPRGSSVQPWQ